MYYLYNMKEYSLLVDDNKITIQKQSYIEGGWHIEIVDDVITLYDMPMGGSYEQTIGTYKTIRQAMDTADTLT